ncbi:MAG: phosphate/phosphite/phosphonate ABC transporter substrate-binding protein [Marinobacter sp.]
MYLKFVLIALSTLCSFLPDPAYANPKTLVFGIVPQESAGRLAEQWTPLMVHLSEVLGREVRFSTAPDIPTFEQRIREGRYDIAYMNPYHYVEFSRNPGYRAIAREGGKRIHGIVVVADNSGLRSLQDLENKVLAFPAPAAFAATVLVRAELERLGIVYTPRFVSSHESVYLNVARGLAVAGGGIERTFNSPLSSGIEGLRVLWRTQGYTPHAFAVHPNLSSSETLAVQRALTTLGEHEHGRDLLSQASLGTLDAAANDDWDDVRALQLDFLTAEDQ